MAYDEDLANLIRECLAGEPEVAHSILARPPLEVLKLGAFALEGRQVFVGSPCRVVALGREGLDLSEQGGRRDVDLVGAFLRAGP